jgi:hypothetical protein
VELLESAVGHLIVLHGAAPTTGMTRIAILEHPDGNAVDGMEHVNDQQSSARNQIDRP